MFTVNITHLCNPAARFLSASVAEMGQDAGAITWRNCMRHPDQPIPADQFDCFRDWVESSGGWTREEIDAWTDDELQALCLQWIVGDIRECGLDDPLCDWEEVIKGQRGGQYPSSVYRGDDGQIYWECSQ